MLVRKGVGWDDPLGDDEGAQWRHWLEDLPKLSERKSESRRYSVASR